MNFPVAANLRTRLTLWYVSVLAVLLLVYATLVFAFQYAVLTRQLFHDEVQDVVTVEGLLYFDSSGQLQLRQDYYSRPQSHLLIDRLMEVRDPSGTVLYRSPTLHGMSLGGANRPGEGDTGFNERIIRIDDGAHVFVVSHIHSLQGHTLLIRLGYSLAPLRTRMLQFLLLLVVSIPLAIALAAITGQIIARRALRPLAQMAGAAEGITASNLDQRLEIADTADELGHIAKSFNHLLNRLEQAFAQLQRFTADAAHELRTPLASLRAVGEVALEEGSTEEAYREALGSILEETARLNESIDGLLLLARAEATQPQNRHSSVRIREIVDEILQLLDVVIVERQVEVIQHGEGFMKDVFVLADRSLLRTAILNVIHNALKFSPENSALRITYSRGAEVSPNLIMIIQDEGPGIAPGEHQKVFERFFTGSSDMPRKGGSGLGLSIAKLIIDRIGGRIYFDEAINSGARCTLEIPISNERS